MTGAELAQLISDGEGARRANGCFAVIHGGREASAVTDRYGAVPVYVATRGGRASFSFDAWELVASGRTGASRLDDSAVADLLLLGHVRGSRTLIEGLAVVPPGAEMSTSGVRRYWRYTVDDGDPVADSHLGEVVAGVAERLRDRIDGCGGSATVALSDGIDSEFALAVTARSGRPVDCVTYGRADDPTVVGANAVAQRRGVPHRQVEVRSVLSEDALAIATRQIGPTARCTVGVGMRTIATEGHGSGLLVAGHPGAVVGGRTRWYSQAATSHRSARRHVAAMYLDDPITRVALSAVFDFDVAAHASVIVDDVLGAATSAPNAVQRWELEERQRQLMLAEMRVIEDATTWALPLLDHELVDVMARVPDEDRVGKRQFRRVVAAHLEGRPHSAASAPSGPWRSRVAIAGAPLVHAGRRAPAVLGRRVSPFGPDPIRWQVRHDPLSRGYVLDRLASAGVPGVRLAALRHAVERGIGPDALYQRVVPAVLTIDEVMRMAGSARPAGTISDPRRRGSSPRSDGGGVENGTA